MNTREKIIAIGDTLIRKRGFNAFSFSDISKELNIKNASVHYHFPTKTLLVIAVIQKHLVLLEKFRQKVADETPLQKIIKFLAVYSIGKTEGKISILGALTTDYYTFDAEVQTELKILTDSTLNWLTETLKTGVKEDVFRYRIADRVKAIQIITSILGAEQLSRITYPHDFEAIKDTIINDILP